MDISIIIPVYNNEKYIDKCIKSVINQKTKLNYEVIAVNDGSTDHSLEKLNKYKDKIIIVDKKNTGPGDSRNIGIKKSKGKYLMFVDSDDYVSENFVDKMYTKIVSCNADVAICDFYRVNNDGTMFYLNKGKEGIYKKNSINEVLMMDFHSCNKIFKRSLALSEKYPTKMFYEDVVYISKLLINANSIVKFNDPLYYYRNNEKGTTNVLNSTNYDLLKALDMIEDTFIKNNYTDEIEYLYADGVLADLMIKIIKSNLPNKKQEFNRLKKMIDEKYPNWYKNKYLKNSKIFKKLYFWFLKHNMYSIINLVFKSR